MTIRLTELARPTFYFHTVWPERLVSSSLPVGCRDSSPLRHTSASVAGIHLNYSQERFPPETCGNDNPHRSPCRWLAGIHPPIWHPAKDPDRFPIKNIGNDALIRSSPQIVSGDPSEKRQKKFPVPTVGNDGAG
jgi:hypothetical protein